MSTQPVVNLETKVGPVEVSFTEAGHAYVTSDGRYGSTLPGFVAYRGQQFRLSAHLYAKNSWGLGEFDATVSKRPFGAGDAAPTHRAAILEAVIEAVRTYAEENPQVLETAQRFHINNKLSQAFRAEQEAEQVLSAARRERHLIEAELMALDAAH